MFRYHRTLSFPYVDDHPDLSLPLSLFLSLFLSLSLSLSLSRRVFISIQMYFHHPSSLSSSSSSSPSFMLRWMNVGGLFHHMDTVKWVGDSSPPQQSRVRSRKRDKEKKKREGRGASGVNQKRGDEEEEGNERHDVRHITSSSSSSSSTSALTTSRFEFAKYAFYGLLEDSVILFLAPFLLVFLFPQCLECERYRPWEMKQSNIDYLSSSSSSSFSSFSSSSFFFLFPPCVFIRMFAFAASALSGLSFLGHTLQFIVVLASGGMLPDLMFRPEHSRDLREFWGRRWNSVIQTMVKRYGYDPVRARGYSHVAGATTAFFLSG